MARAMACKHIGFSGQMPAARRRANGTLRCFKVEKVQLWKTQKYLAQNPFDNRRRSSGERPGLELTVKNIVPCVDLTTRSQRPAWVGSSRLPTGKKDVAAGPSLGPFLKNHKEVTLIVLLIDERAEEVTDWQRAGEGRSHQLHLR